MRKLHLLPLAAITLILFTFAACKQTPEATFVLNGTINGATEGSVILTGPRNFVPDTAVIENGTFIFAADIPEPAQYALMFPDHNNQRVTFYAENANMTFNGHVDSLRFAFIEGGAVQNDHNEFVRRTEALSEKHNIAALRGPSRTAGRAQMEETRNALIEAMEKFNEERKELVPDFIKDHPTSYYSVLLIQQNARGKSGEMIESELHLLSQQLASNPLVVSLWEMVDNLKEAEQGFEAILGNAHELQYAIDPSFNGRAHSNVEYLAVCPDDNIAALRTDGSVRIMDPNGKTIRDFKPSIKSTPASLAIDQSGKIYILGTKHEVRTVESRGQTREVRTPAGVECLVYSMEGKKLGEIELPGVTSVSGARAVGNDLIIADQSGRRIAVYDVVSGENKTKIENMRACCGILDISIGPNKEILIANLGAFRVEGYDYSGEMLLSFGRAGTGINDFHGCCNPVSVAYLSNGGIVTVEKSPTRIKVFSSDGARQIAGIDELVEGCNYIPMIVDSKDNLYMASEKMGMMKCVATKQVAAR
jgi:hypothetical protein